MGLNSIYKHKFNLAQQDKTLALRFQNQLLALQDILSESSVMTKSHVFFSFDTNNPTLNYPNRYLICCSTSGCNFWLNRCTGRAFFSTQHHCKLSSRGLERDSWPPCGQAWTRRQLLSASQNVEGINRNSSSPGTLLAHTDSQLWSGVILMHSASSPLH